MQTLSRRPMAFGYARVSDMKQIQQNDSVPIQQDRIESYYKFKLAPKGVDFGGIEWDPWGVSAFKQPFHRREAAKRLMSIMQPGDHMIVDKIDRLTRRIRDLYSVTDWMEKHQISLHVCTFLGTDMDFSTPVGALIFGVFGLLADFESKQISERQNTHNSACRAKGLCISKYPAPGTEYYWKKGQDGKKRRYAKWSATDRAIMAELVILREQAHLSWDEISDTIEIHLAQQNGRQFKKSAFYQRRWPREKCRRAYVVEKYYQDHNIRDVTEIPASLGILADKHAKANHYK